MVPLNNRSSQINISPFTYYKVNRISKTDGVSQSFAQTAMNTRTLMTAIFLLYFGLWLLETLSKTHFHKNPGHKMTSITLTLDKYSLSLVSEWLHASDK